MNSDSYFWIGSTHDVCQDYVQSVETRQGPCVVLSDGCSSSPKTDWGSRLIVDAASKILVQDPNLSLADFGEEVILEARSSVEFLRMTDRALDATLIVATPKFVRCYGDEVVAMVKEDGTIFVWSVIFPSGAPLYLNYLNDSRRLAGYFSEFGGKTLLLSGTMHPGGLDLFQFTEGSLDRDYPAFGIEFCVMPDTVAIAVMSDGMTSFMEEKATDTTKTNEEVGLVDVITKMFPFKNYNGEFVKRRAKRFVKDCKDLKWQNTDDVSIGALYLG